MKIQWTGHLQLPTTKFLFFSYDTVDETIVALEKLTGYRFTNRFTHNNGRAIKLYGYSVAGIVEQVKYKCPVKLMGTEETWFYFDQKFLVRFSREWQDNQALSVMTLDELINMVERFHLMEYPIDVYFTEYEYEEVDTAEDMLDSYSAWPIPDGWLEQFPFEFPVGRFINDEFFPE